MHGYARPADRARNIRGCGGVHPFFLVLAIALTGLLAGGCGGPRAGGEFVMEDVTGRWSNGRVYVTYRQRMKLSPEAQEALVHGVPLTLETEIILRDVRKQTRVSKHRTRHEIRYLPLSEHYQLSAAADETVKTFPRLRHALAALDRAELSFDTGALPAGEYELLVRSYLDKKVMPPPMRLPVLFSSNWNHESDWTSWPLNVEPEA